MASFVIEIKANTKVLDYVKEAISLYISYKLSFRLERIVYVLGDLVAIKNVGIKEYRYNSDEKRQLFFRAIKRLSKYKQISILNIKRAIKYEISQIYKAKKRTFILVFVWNVPLVSLHARSFTINKMRFNVLSLRSVSKTFDFKEPIAKMKLDQYEMADLNRLAYFVAEIHGKNESSVFRKAYHNEEILRSIFNFELAFHKIAIQVGRPVSLSKIESPKHIFVFDDSKKFLNHWMTADHHDKVFSPTVDQMNVIKKLVKKFEDLQKCPLKEMLEKSLALYNSALDQVERPYSFLLFWQVLELIGLGELNWRGIRKRLASIFYNKPLMGDSLEAVCRKRNMLVHRGSLSMISLSDANQTKAIAEACMDFLFLHSEKLKDKEGLLAFYGAAMLNKNKLKKKITIDRYVLKKMP